MKTISLKKDVIGGLRKKWAVREEQPKSREETPDLSGHDAEVASHATSYNLVLFVRFCN